MNTTTHTNTIPLLVLAVFAIANAIDFIFYGQRPYNLAALIGILLMAFGILNGKKAASSLGAALAIIAIASKYI